VEAEAVDEINLVPSTGTPLTARDRRVLPALCLGMFVAMLTFVAPAPFFPTMARDLNVGVPLLGQVVAAMLLVSAAIGLVAGPLADRYGHRRLILLGLVSATICLLAFGLAPTFPVLLIGALAGGLANAAVLGPSLAVAGTYFTGAEARRALGWATASMAGSAIVGWGCRCCRPSPPSAAGGWRSSPLVAL
jgi:DHA2 family methylenomycin A resistance protein-like MFS transporter